MPSADLYQVVDDFYLSGTALQNNFTKINVTPVLGTLMVHIPCRFHQRLWSFETCFSSNGTCRTFIQMIR